MNSVIKYVFICIALLVFSPSFGQKKSDKLRQEQERLEKSIATTKSLLKKAKLNSKATLGELRVLENQVKYREELLVNYDNQIRSAELQIDQKAEQIEELEAKLKELVIQYKKLLIYAYKHRSKEGKWMYIFAAKTYNEALKRKKYLEKIAELQRKQKEFIEQHQRLISKEKTTLEKEKETKVEIAEQKRQEKESLEKDKVLKEQNFSKLKKEESKLSAEIKLNENKKIILRQRIKEAINAELAAEEARRKAKEKKLLAEQKAKNNANVTSSLPATTTKTEKASNNEVPTSKTKETEEAPKRVLTISETKEVALNQSFESNKGRLPWPVANGTITEGYGKHEHPKIKNLFTNNNGVDISTNRGSNVRAVFEGEVTSVLSIPGAGKIVIIKHGNYRTVYSNLQEVYVSTGTKIKTKQSIGSLLPDEDGSLSVAHFEIHHVTNGQILRMNPSNWITR